MVRSGLCYVRSALPWIKHLPSLPKNHLNLAYVTRWELASSGNRLSRNEFRDHTKGDIGDLLVKNVILFTSEVRVGGCPKKVLKGDWDIIIPKVEKRPSFYHRHIGYRRQLFYRCSAAAAYEGRTLLELQSALWTS